MLKISHLVSLPVINIYGVKIEGYVEKIVFNPEKKVAEYLIIYDENTDIFKCVNFKDVYKFGENSILIRNNSKITLYENSELNIEKLINPINAICYSITGDNLGKINEIIVNTSGELISINTSSNYSSDSIIGFNEQLILLSPNKKVSIKKFRNLPKRIKLTKGITPEQVVTILENSQSKESQNYNFLLNRKILKDIKTSNGEILAHKNSTVNLNIITKLKYYGKLKELTLNSK